MKFLNKLLGVTALAASLAGSAWAAPVAFDVTNSSFTPGSGYGGGSSGLDVSFSANGARNVFSLLNGESQTFTFGTVTLNETDISALELGGLGVSANFSFDSPLDALRSVTATGTATRGAVSDAGTDLVIDWSDITVTVGGTQFRISMNDLTFSSTGSLTQSATITLLSGGTASAVPEPASLALVGGAMVLMGGLRRRRQG